MKNLDKLKIATVTMNSISDYQRNIEESERLIIEAAKRGADWVILPELFPFHGPYDQLKYISEPEGGLLFEKLSELSKSLNIILFAGSVHEKSEMHPEKVFNTAYIFDRNGKKIGKYRKIHLFNLNDPDPLKSYCESQGFLAGEEEPLALEIDGWKAGVGICYDLRFPKYFANLNKRQKQDIIILPAAFTKKTGALHWELLLRSRAVEYQSFVVGVNQTGVHWSNKESYGHSLVIDPLGAILSDSGEIVGVELVEIEKKKIQEVRDMIPVFDNTVEI